MKMKGLLAVIFLVVSTVVCEPPAAPYPPRGFRPNGPAFELPQKTQNTPQQQYLPTLDPRRPLTPNTEYGVPEEEDVSVQGIPSQEQLPIFQPSPINGQQYVGPTLQADLKKLDEAYKQHVYKNMQEQYREYQRQRQLDAEATNRQAPRVFGRTTVKPETTTKIDSTTFASTTEADLNEGETLDDKQAKVTVEVSKERLQEYPGEFYLSSFAQLQLQPVQQFGQLRSPIIVQQQKGYDPQIHFAALPSILAQQQLLQQLQSPVQGFRDQSSYAAPVQPLNVQTPQYPVQLQPFPQVQAQPAQDQFYQPQPDTEEVVVKNDQPQFVYQPQTYQPLQPQTYQSPQPQTYQPTQPQTYQPLQPQTYQPLQPQFTGQQFQGQLINYPQDYQNLQQQFEQNRDLQGQDAFLQSGLDVNQQGNGVEDDKEQEDDGNTAVSVATAFGTRTQPRTQYGAPFPRAQMNPGYQTTESVEVTTDGAAVAEATAVTGNNPRRKSAKLRNRRVRPIFTLDKSGHLVLAEQN